MSTPLLRRATLLAMALLTVLLAIAAGVTPGVAAHASSSGVAAPAADGGGGSASTHRWSDGSQVTVAQTANLIHQVVQVSWSGLAPTTYVGSIDNGGGSTDGVDVLQCWGLHPRREDCWYAPSTMEQPYRDDYTAYTSWTVPGDPAETAPYRTWWHQQISPSFTPSTGKAICAQYGCAHDIAGITAAPDFSLLPTNEQLGQTASNGTGSVGFEVRTRDQLPSLGCDDTHPCSLVVIPTDHPVTGPAVTASDSAASTEFAFRLTASHWADRAVFPLRFAHQSATCPFSSDQTQVTASEAAAAAIVRWQPALCVHGAGGVRVAAALTTEPDSIIRTQLASGVIPVGVLNRAVTTTTAHPLVVAPVLASGAAVSFVIDDARTGAPVRRLDLDARLVAKLLTESYCSFVCGTNTSYPADPNVAGNPEVIWQDPELAQLNPGVTFFPQGAYAPELEYFDSDAFYTLTRWIDEDPTARAWLDGKPDPWGMRVNTRYRHWALPVSAPVKLDPWKVPTRNPRCVPASAGDCVLNGYDVLDLKYQFVNSMDAAAQNVTVGQSSDASNNQPDPNHPGQTVFGKVAAASYPNRAILGIMTTSQAATLGLPMASLRNGRGQFVSPTPTALHAGLTAMTFHRATGTYDLDPASKAAGVYPLTMVTSVMAPAAGLDRTTATKLAAIIRYASGPGQVTGTGLGQLPAGYVPVTAAMRAQAAAAATEIGDQTAATPTPSPSRTSASPRPTTATPTPTPTRSRQPARAPAPAPVSIPTAPPAVSDPTVPAATVPTSGALPTTVPFAPTPTAPPAAAVPSPAAPATPVVGRSPDTAVAVSPATPVATSPAAAGLAAGSAATPLALAVSSGGNPGRWILLVVLTLGVAAAGAALVLTATGPGSRLVSGVRRRLGTLRTTPH